MWKCSIFMCWFFKKSYMTIKMHLKKSNTKRQVYLALVECFDGARLSSGALGPMDCRNQWAGNIQPDRWKDDHQSSEASLGPGTATPNPNHQAFPRRPPALFSKPPGRPAQTLESPGANPHKTHQGAVCGGGAKRSGTTCKTHLWIATPQTLDTRASQANQPTWSQLSSRSPWATCSDPAGISELWTWEETKMELMLAGYCKRGL